MKAGSVSGVVMDLFSRRIVGWSMKTSIDRTLVIGALEMACLQCRPEAYQTIFHSDRGTDGTPFFVPVVMRVVLC
jgi:transposase InsO family protein